MQMVEHINKNWRLQYEEGTYSPSITRMDTDKISELADSELRYALRFADAANAAGWLREGPGWFSGHAVYVMATDEDRESRLLEATYTGIVDKKTGADTFLENLQRFDPNTSQA